MAFLLSERLTATIALHLSEPDGIRQTSRQAHFAHKSPLIFLMDFRSPDGRPEQLRGPTVAIVGCRSGKTRAATARFYPLKTGLVRMFRQRSGLKSASAA